MHQADQATTTISASMGAQVFYPPEFQPLIGREEVNRQWDRSRPLNDNVVAFRAKLPMPVAEPPEPSPQEIAAALLAAIMASMKPAARNRVRTQLMSLEHGHAEPRKHPAAQAALRVIGARA